MKVSKELNDALEKVAKEVEAWPAWKRSVDLFALNKPNKNKAPAPTTCVLCDAPTDWDALRRNLLGRQAGRYLEESTIEALITLLKSEGFHQ